MHIFIIFLIVTYHFISFCIDEKKYYIKKNTVHIIIKLHRTYIKIYNVISDMYPLYRHLQENVFVSIYISKIVLVMIENRIKTILKCNKADPDGMPLPKGGVRVVVSHTTPKRGGLGLWCHTPLPTGGM